MSDDAHEYTDEFVAGLQAMWGAGFLSPGGPGEVAAILTGVELAGTRVLDIGCGLAGIDCLLVSEHGAATVVGIDVEPALIDHGTALVRSRGLSERISLRTVTPGALPFADADFDVVFSKDSIIHVEDKLALYAEARRVLRGGGWFIGGDWLRGADAQAPSLRAWLDAVGLTFGMSDLATSRELLQRAGFEAVEVVDRNDWYRTEVIAETERLETGAGRAALESALGSAGAAQRIRSNALRRAAVIDGSLRPAHFRARRG